MWLQVPVSSLDYGSTAPSAVQPDAGLSSVAGKKFTVTVQEQRSVTTDTPTTTESGGFSNRTVTSRQLDVRPSNNETARRIVVLVFGLIQIVIGLRIVLLLLNAHTGNFIVSVINNVGGVLIAPFEGILRTNALSAGGSVFDVAAVVALVGWTIVELIVIWGLGVFRREPALA
jgi:hypothetical protein